MATVKINGKEITVEDGTLILDAARDAGYEIPTFCYQADLVGIGSCRMCLVEIEGQKKLQPSCVTPVLHGMSILTETPTVMTARASMLEFLLANHALDCPVCDKGGECELQDAVHKYGPHKGRHSEKKFKFHEKDYILSPVIIKNSNRCVQCLKCVRVCREVVGANVLTGLNRGDHQEATSFLRTFLDCDQDGNCIEVCPVGCFMRLPYRYKVRPWDLKSADTVCPYCATGCRMVIEERAGQAVRSKAQLGVGINSETLCARGRFGFDFINSPERLTSPMLRKFGKLEPVSWDEAISAVKDNLGAFAGERIGAVASPRLTNEELYMFQKFMRVALGSPNIDSSLRWSPEAAESYIAATDMPSGGVSAFDCMSSDALLIIGGNLTEENPVTDYIVRRISAQRNMHVIVASVRGMRLDSSANVSVRHLPAAEGALLSAVNAELASQTDHALLKIAGVTEDEVKNIAKRIKSANSVAIMAGTDFLRFGHGIAGLNAFKEALKKAGKKVTIMPVLDRANQRGAWEMGVHPWLAPGYRKAEVKGLGTEGMLSAALGGELDALYLNGTDIVSGYIDEEFAREALSKLKFLVVQDAFLTETAKLAHVVLPGSVFAETDGTFTNQEGRVQLIRRLLKPPGAKTGLGVIGSLGRAFISSFGPKGASAVFEEISKEASGYNGVSLLFNNKKNVLNRLDNKEALLKRFSAPALETHGFAPAPVEGADEPGSMLLVTGNHLFHSGAFSMRSITLAGLLKAAVAELSEEDAAVRGLKDGDKVRVKGGGYEAVLTLRINKGTRKGVCFIAENFEDVPVRKFLKKNGVIKRVTVTKAH